MEEDPSPALYIDAPREEEDVASEPGDDAGIAYQSKAAIPWEGIQDEITPHIIARGRRLELDCLEFDVQGECGQIRRLQEDLVVERLSSMRSTPPTHVAQVLVWQERHGVEKFKVLGGQHTVAALKRRREELLKDARAVPPPFQYVEADILEVKTPKDLRERAAGDHQSGQSHIRDVPMSRIVGFVVAGFSRNPPLLGDAALVNAVQKSGRPGRPTTFGQLRGTWLPLYYFAQTLREQAEVCAARMEANGEELTPHSFLPIRPIRTQEHRLLACRCLQSSATATWKRWKADCEAALHEMWVSWHWRPGNPHIAEDKGVYWWVWKYNSRNA